MEHNVYSISYQGLINITCTVEKEGQILFKATYNFFKSAISLFDASAESKIVIKKKRGIFNQDLEIIRGTEVLAKINKRSLSNKYDILTENQVLTINGSLLNREFTISNGDQEIAKISRHLFRRKDKYGIAIVEGQDDKLLLAILMALDLRLRMEQG